MLRRTLHRSSQLLPRNPVAPHRWIHSTPIGAQYNAQYNARPPSISARIWFRRDGTPRSKLKGLFLGSLTVVTLYTMYTMLEMLQELDSANYLLNCLVHVQHCDTDFASVDLQDSTSVLSYFRELCSSFKDVPQQTLEDFFNDVERVSGAAGEGRTEAYQITRDACERVHDILLKSKGKDPWDTATEIVSTLDDAVVKLVELVEDAASDDDDERVLRYQMLKEQRSKDSSSKSSDYEVLG